MKLSDWAKEQGVCYRTAYNWFKSGKFNDMNINAKQLSTGTILVEENSLIDKSSNVVIYSRVSTYERKDCLIGQIERCSNFANGKGLEVNKVYKEIASGMNDKRPKLMKLLDSKPTHIIVEHKDRLTRFGFNYLEKLLNQQGCVILVLNRDNEDETDLMKDLVSIITSFCCRLYGMRRGQNKAKKLKEELSK
jgi:putative resolvase